ncbi:MAG: phosphatase PAP2 family protein [Verrucomicrobiaceae bacterium]|nr:MAG: phosphatase PAP2 family protein [Verrucomicrobiaceae bacterium]
MNSSAGQFLARLKNGWLREPLVPILILAVLAGIWGFVEIAGEVMEKETHEFDERILLAMREPGNTSDPIGSPRVEEMARDLTALGGFTLLTGVTLVSAGVALFAGRGKLALLSIISIVTGTYVMTLLKQGYDRPRPDLVEHGTLVHNASFPSGHSMMSAMVWLTLGILLARTQPKKRVRAFIIGISVLVTLLVGVSRVYLGVHWPTDVLGGWVLGAAWALLFWLVAMRVDPRKPPVE